MAIGSVPRITYAILLPFASSPYSYGGSSSAWNCMCAATSRTNPACTRHIFTERLPTVVAPYARRTTRLDDVLTLIGFAPGGQAGKRLVAGMGLSTSPDTLLRLMHAAPELELPTPRVLGVDDFSYSTVARFLSR